MNTDADRVRYSAVEETESGWSVIENATGLAFLIEGIPMVLLRGDVAFALAQTLNEIASTRKTFHRQFERQPLAGSVASLTSGDMPCHSLVYTCDVTANLMDEFIEPRLPASITDNTPLGPALVNLAVVLSDQPETGFATSNISAQKLIARRRRRDRTLAIG